MSNDEQASMQTMRELLHIRYHQHDLYTWQAHIPELTAALRVLAATRPVCSPPRCGLGTTTRRS